MNEDNYVEWLIKRKDPVYGLPLKGLMIFICIAAVISALQTVFGIVFLILAGGATYFVFLHLSVEYEYLFADGGLRIDRILRRARRKKVFDCEKEDIQLIAPVDSYTLKDYEKQGMRIQDYTSGRGNAKVYALIYQKGPEHIKVLFEPNGKMLEAMRRRFPRKLVM